MFEMLDPGCVFIVAFTAIFAPLTYRWLRNKDHQQRDLIAQQNKLLLHRILDALEGEGTNAEDLTRSQSWPDIPTDWPTVLDVKRSSRELRAHWRRYLPPPITEHQFAIVGEIMAKSWVESDLLQKSACVAGEEEVLTDYLDNDRHSVEEFAA